MAVYSDKAMGILAVLADKPIAYHPKLAKVLGVNEAIFVCQLLYWDDKGKLPDGWIFKTQVEWTEETGLSRSELETVRKHLVHRGILNEKLRGVPATINYKLNFDKLIEILNVTYCQANQFAGTPQTESSLQEPRKLDCGKPANKIAETPQTIQEITSETTTKICANAPTEPIKVPSEQQQYFGVIATALRIPYQVASNGQKGRIGKLTNRIKSLYSLQEIQDADRYWWHDDWRGKKGDAPSDDLFVQTLEKLRKQREENEQKWRTV